VFVSVLFVCKRVNITFLHVRYSRGCGRIARVSVFAIRAYVDE